MAPPTKPSEDTEGAYLWALLPLAGAFPVHWDTGLDGWFTLCLKMQRKRYVITGETVRENGTLYYWHRILRGDLAELAQ